MTIGKSLQSKRLEKQLSLTDVSHSLKIDEKTLQQIEADNFTGLNPVVVRSYIRQYASLLGLDGAKLLDAYTNSASQTEAPAAQAAPVQKVQQTPAPAPKKKTEAEIKLAKAQKAVANSHSVRGLKSIFNLFDKINLDKFLKYGIWVIMGLAVVGSVAKGFSTAASKISTNQSSSVSSSSKSSSASSQDKKQPPKKDEQPSSQASKSAPDDQNDQSSAESFSSQADEASSSSSSSAQKASSASYSSAAQSSSSSASSQSSQADEASSSSENATK